MYICTNVPRHVRNNKREYVFEGGFSRQPGAANFTLCLRNEKQIAKERNSENERRGGGVEPWAWGWVRLSKR
jgi:hypothetical protein